MPTPTTPSAELAEIVVNGRRIYFEYVVPVWVPPLEPPLGQVDEIGQDPEIEYPCQVVSGLSDAEKLRYLVRFAMAVWRAELLANPVQDREFGTYFYLDVTGEIKTTPIGLSGNQTAFLDVGALPKLPNGQPDYSRVIVIAHSHPRYNLDGQGNTVDYFNPADPTYLQRPSPPYIDNGGNQMYGDWATYDSVVAYANYQQANFGGNGPRADLSLAIFGSDGNTLKINQYFPEHRGQSGTGVAVNDEPFPPCSE